ncbi:SDR family oxidoreductase [Micromonospora sp. NPDC048170]|uniref:SDR family oxidoreductase n=1 Tax=Micromonospora sp. NPDC048170 TaxID=3154819 RepID=UPI0033D615BF
MHTREWTGTGKEARRRRAVVMAASRGLGRAAAHALAGSGHDITVCGRTPDLLAEVAGELRDYGGVVDAVQADVATPAGVDRVIRSAEQRLGGVDVLVTNAGGPPAGRFLGLGEEQWNDAYQLTLMSTVRALSATLPAMVRSGYGRVVVIGSSSVFAPLEELTLSNAFRPALAGLVSSVAREVAEHGVTINLIAPGRFTTDRVRDLDERRARAAGVEYEQFRQQAQARIPAGRYGHPEELGALVAFLASDAASYLTGQSLLVDGGLVSRTP